MAIRAISLIVLLALMPGRVFCTRCALKLTGESTDGTVSVASLSCTGGPNLTAAADPLLVARMHAVGVDWRDPSACNSSAPTCLLSVCGGADVTFEGASIEGLDLPTGHVLCLAANSTMTIINSQLVGNTAAMIHARDASLTVVNTTIKDNACSQPNQGRTGITVEGDSRLHIQDSQFVNNSHTLLEGHVLHIRGKTSATISNTSFSNNRVVYPVKGGAVKIFEQSTGVSTHVITMWNSLTTRSTRMKVQSSWQLQPLLLMPLAQEQSSGACLNCSQPRRCVGFSSRGPNIAKHGMCC
jgi:hypothetical protein